MPSGWRGLGASSVSNLALGTITYLGTGSALLTSLALFGTALVGLGLFGRRRNTGNGARRLYDVCQIAGDEHLGVSRDA